MPTNTPAPEDARLDPSAGARIYTPGALDFYDIVVHGLSNTFAWRCPTKELIAQYNRNVGSRHMDIGVGTGLFLDRCRFPTPNPTIALVDLNPSALAYTKKRIGRYRPTTHEANVLEPFELDVGPFDSIALNYLLHCLPGDMKSKRAVFANIEPHLAEGGVVFGATILGRSARHNLLARTLIRAYNARGVFGNRDDSLAELEAALGEYFKRVSIVVHGSVALFTAR